MHVVAALALGVLSNGTARQSASPAADGAPVPSGYELIGRMPSGEPFGSAEVEQVAGVLRGRLQSVETERGSGVTAEAGRRLLVTLPDAPSESAVEALRPRFEPMGRLSSEGVAGESTPGFSEREESWQLRAWWSAQSAPDLEPFNALARAEGGPAEFIR